MTEIALCLVWFIFGIVFGIAIGRETVRREQARARALVEKMRGETYYYRITWIDKDGNEIPQQTTGAKPCD